MDPEPSPTPPLRDCEFESMNLKEPQFILLMIHLLLIGIFHYTFASKTALDKNGLRSRGMNVNVSVFIGFINNLIMYLRYQTGSMQCWFFTSVIMISPPMVIFPYFMMSIEHWGRERKNKMRWLPMRLFGKIVPRDFGSWGAPITICVVFIAYIFLAVGVNWNLYKNLGEEEFFNGDCSLGNYVWVLVCLFAANVLLGMFCFFLQYDSEKGTDFAVIRASKLFVREQNLVFGFSLLMVGAYFVMYFFPAVYEQALRAGFDNPNIFIYLSNMAPIIFSGLLDQIFTVWNKRAVLRQTISSDFFTAKKAVANKVNGGRGRGNGGTSVRGRSVETTRSSSAVYGTLGEDVELDDANPQLEVQLESDEEVELTSETRTAFSSVGQKVAEDSRFEDLPDLEKMVWFAITRDSVIELECLESVKTRINDSEGVTFRTPLINAKLLLAELGTLQLTRNEERVKRLCESEEFAAVRSLAAGRAYDDQVNILRVHMCRVWATCFMDAKKKGIPDLH